MLRKTIFSLLLSLALVSPAAAEGTGLYVSGKFLDSYQTNYGGGFLTGTDSSNTIGFAFAGGYDFYMNSDTPVRTEIEYAFRSAFMGEENSSFNGNHYGSDVRVNVHTLMANVYYDFYNESAFTPYVGGGIGIGYLEGDFATGGSFTGQRDIEDYVLAFNFGAGVGYSFTDNLTADLGYRYLNLGASESNYYGNDLTTHLSAHEFSLGLRLGF